MLADKHGQSLIELFVQFDTEVTTENVHRLLAQCPNLISLSLVCLTNLMTDEYFLDLPLQCPRLTSLHVYEPGNVRSWSPKKVEHL